MFDDLFDTVADIELFLTNKKLFVLIGVEMILGRFN